MTATESHARITSLFVQDVFVSSEENELKADVEIVNDSNLAHSAQVVFRGYVRNGNTLLYEFLHEQVWIFIRPSGMYLLVSFRRLSRGLIGVCINKQINK
ncbi:unnamed protein product [Haemonchus placei]|uniref:Translocon-associated protein subunit beta n=1 Tax=Haemonchus placei TaxID=6290 RepID=A0A0N4VWU6_HAEPC|nr:unnamed protein product [Haemonchus placei]